MIPVTTGEEMRALDGATIQGLGLPGVVLMEHAGFGVLLHMEDYFGDLEDRRILVVCGKGNNGGDGFVVARWAMSRGAQVEVVLLTELEQLKGDALVNASVFHRLHPERLHCVPEGTKALEGLLSWSEMVVDGILGTGLASAARGLAAQAIDLINSSGRPVVAIDISSGLSTDTGWIPGPAVDADLTVTFGLPKIAHYTFPAADLAGEVRVVDIGIPPQFVEEAGILVHLPEEMDVSFLLPPRPLNAHKGRYGHLLGIAGSPGKTGAGIMTAQAALRVGTGLVTMGVPGSLNPIYESCLLEAMTLPLPDDEGYLLESALEVVGNNLQGKTALAVGPGLGTNPSTVALVRALVTEVDLPMVIDADGVNALVGDLGLLKDRKAPTVLTPHPGEMARLLGASPGEVQERRLETAREFAREYGVVLVLKGAGTVTALPDGGAYINTTGNPGMASGGSGDVLTGIIGGFLAQGMDAGDAAWAGVYLHGLAGDQASQGKGEVALLAGDMIDAISGIMKEWEEQTSSSLIGD